MNFPALLHFAEEGGVFLATGNQQKARGFAIEPADEGEKLLWVVVAEPVDESEGAVRSGGVDQPTGRFIDDQEARMVEDDGGIHELSFGEIGMASKGRGREIKKWDGFKEYRIWDIGYGGDSNDN